MRWLVGWLARQLAGKSIHFFFCRPAALRTSSGHTLGGWWIGHQPRDMVVLDWHVMFVNNYEIYDFWIRTQNRFWWEFGRQRLMMFLVKLRTSELCKEATFDKLFKRCWTALRLSKNSQKVLTRELNFLDHPASPIIREGAVPTTISYRWALFSWGKQKAISGIRFAQHK